MKLHTISLVTFFFMLLLGIAHPLNPHYFSYRGKASQHKADPSGILQKEKKEELGMELYPTGSSLPDCSHACGPCFPCKIVMVSFKCSVAESCPVVYRCMCKGKYYHVPSN